MPFKHGIVQIVIITRQHFGTVPTYCTKCKEPISFKIIKEDGSYTQLCKCGCNIFQFHLPDKFHKTPFFTRKFISAKAYNPDFKNKDLLEKEGFEKTEKNGVSKYTK